MSLIARAISWIDHKNIIIQIYIYLDYFALLLAAAARARIGCWLLLDKFGAINLVRNKLFPAMDFSLLRTRFVALRCLVESLKNF